jgi:hypothetical protein
VEDHDVARANHPRERFTAGRERRLVEVTLGLAERTAIAGEPVQAVVDPLGYGEERATPPITSQRASTWIPRA